MKYFTTINDIKSAEFLISEALKLKKNPFGFSQLGKNKTLGIIFMNPSLRTRLSTQKAAQNLGMNTVVMNFNQEGWALEYEDGAIMNGNTVEHIKDAAAVMGTYCDIIAIRCFPSLKNKQEDYSEKILLQFMKYCNKPVISLESATLHPLQSLADVMTIEENKPGNKKPKVVLTWAPHIKPLPQAVANSFCEWIKQSDVEFVIAHPEGYELSEDFTHGVSISNNQNEALAKADFVYVKNWSAFNDYGAMPEVKENWLLNENKMSLTNNAFLMHCLPVRRNVEVIDSLLDNNKSLILNQADNRVFAAQAVLKQMLESNYNVGEQINNTKLEIELCNS
ncbi:MAG: N-acetylornithine carbamoyltransferase [Bacteroidota bacterium]|nr:N-acetylornithine carbamoyltransferase [Bacteroidota bacterium]MDP3147094.1 N-acetylornithine carbamoyltransferase [Bacteroidota bacterium]